MSRIRTIKPEFWTSEQAVSCSRDARLLFIGLWSFCDDGGVHPASCKRLKMEVLPADDCSLENIKCWISELISNDLLHEYIVDGKTYWQVTGWRHQKIDKPTYRHPRYQSVNANTSLENSKNTLGAFDEYSTSPPGGVDELSATECNVMEGNGINNICRVSEPSLSVISESNENASTSEILEVFEHWKNAMDHPRAKLDPKRRRKITEAFKLGYSVSDLKLAIDGCSKTPFNMGENERQQRYDDLGLILRDAEHIERFMETSRKSNLLTYENPILSGVI